MSDDGILPAATGRGMNRAMAAGLAGLLLCCILALQHGAHAAQQDAPVARQDGKVSLNFVNAEIAEVVKAVSLITGKNFLIDPRVKGTINIVSASPVPPPLAYDILLSALRLQGFASVESGGVTKIMPEADAKLYVGSAGDGKATGDRLVTRVYELKYASAAKLVPVLRPLIAPNNIVQAYPDSNTLVVTDYASNLTRIEQIVRSLDQPNVEEPVVIPLKHASVMDVAQTINHLMPDVTANGEDSSSFFILLPDARTNSLLVRTDNPARLDRVRELAEKLDIETAAPGNMHVVYLKNAEAVQLEKTLHSVVTGNAAGTPANAAMIQADAASNALIITAPDAIYNNLRAVVEKLDVRRAQVYVEALVVEVTADKAAEFGIQWQGLNGINKPGAQVIGGTNFTGTGNTGNIIGAAGNITTLGQGLNLGIVRGQMTLPDGTKIVNLGMLAHALETDTHANILSTPNLLTLDNEEAKIIVGQNVPFITGSYTTATTPTPFQTVERKDVGLTLRIKPQVSEGGTVKLQLYQEVSSVDSTTLNNTAGVTTNKRSLESSVLVNDGQIIVLGGLIQDSVSNGESKVPLLGDIPLLGNLFRYKTRKQTKTNLMVFIRPYVWRTAEASQGLTEDRYEYLLGEQKLSQMSSNLLLPNMAAPKLPPLRLEQKLSPPASSAKPAPSAP